MIEVILYTRHDCHLCHEVKEYILELDQEIPLVLREIDIDQDGALAKKFGAEIPVVVVGPYTLKAPIERLDLLVTFKAAYQRELDINEINEGIISGRIPLNATWNRADRFTLWLTRNWLSVFNLFVLIYVSLPFLAPILMKSGINGPANVIYKGYSFVCHQFAFRSWFLYGEQAYYPRIEADMLGVEDYQSATGLAGEDLWAARSFVGDATLGYKVALCQRDVAIYFGILMFGVIFGVTKRRLFGIPWYFWILLGILPIGFDGLSQLISQPPLNMIPFRESSPWLRVATGFMFGFFTAWFGYPIAEDSMRDSQEYLSLKQNHIDRSKEGA
jgi:uncharacterized membrane protein